MAENRMLRVFFYLSLNQFIIMEKILLTGEEEIIFLELAKKAAEYIIANNEHVFEKNLKNGFSDYDNSYVTYTNDNKFTFLQCAEKAIYIFLFFRIMTKNGKLWNAQQINIIDIENSKIIELNHRINCE